MTSQLSAALLAAVLCGGLGWFVPRLIAAVPEPDPEPEPDPVLEPSPEEQQPEGAEPDPGKLFSTTLPPAPPKEAYVDIARARGLAPGAAIGTALVGALLGATVGLHGALVYLVPLVPIGAALLVIDWRTHLLPTRIMHPTYLLMAVLVPVAALVDQDLTALYRAGWGWLIVGGWFWGFWFLTRGGGWGFGDVRLSRVLGPALGFLGWYQMLFGLFLMLIVGAVGAVVAAVAGGSLRRRIPYGPYMLIGAVLGVLVGPELAHGLGY